MSSPLRRSLLGSGFTRNAVTKISDLESVRVSGVFFFLNDLGFWDGLGVAVGGWAGLWRVAEWVGCGGWLAGWLLLIFSLRFVI